MIVRLHSQYESVGETATLLVGGSLRPGDEVIMYRILHALPPHIRVARVELGVLEQVDADVIVTVREIVARWRSHRSGQVAALSKAS